MIQIAINQAMVADFCRRWKIGELAFFGSVLRTDFRPESDVDVLVTFAPEAEWSLLDHVATEEEFSAIVGRQVDREQVGGPDLRAVISEERAHQTDRKMPTRRRRYSSMAHE